MSVQPHMEKENNKFFNVVQNTNKLVINYRTRPSVLLQVVLTSAQPDIFLKFIKMHQLSPVPPTTLS